MLSVDYWTVIIQFLNKYDRVNVLKTRKEIYENCKNVPFYFPITLKNIHFPEFLLRAIPKIYTTDISFRKNLEDTYLKKTKLVKAIHLTRDFSDIENIKYFKNVEKIYADYYGNELKSICINMPKLKYLSCNSTLITDLSFFKNLVYLECKRTIIKEIPDMPNIQRLDCSYSAVKSIGKIPKITHLFCSETLIETLPECLNNLRVLDCSYNSYLKFIPNLPNIVDLNCEKTYIEKLPSIGGNLRILNCSKKLLLVKARELNLKKFYKMKYNELLKSIFNI